MAGSLSRRARLADIITDQGSIMSVRCDRCFKLNLECRVLHLYKKCSEYIRSSYRYKREFVLKED
jgi:hypothetical protein